MLVDYASSSGAEGGMSRRGRGLTKADFATDPITSYHPLLIRIRIKEQIK